jgi:hypothetical protein
MTGRRCYIAIASAPLSLLLASLAAAQSYPVRFTRQWKIGDRYRVSATGSSSQSISGTYGDSSSTYKISELSVELVSDATVLQVRSDGRIAKESIVIDHCLVKYGDGKKLSIPKGTLIEASRLTHPKFEIP